MFKSISRWQQSGLTQKAWCDKNNVAYGTFHYWYKRYRSQEEDTIDHEDTGGFVQLMVDTSPVSSSRCELLLPDGKRLVFHQPVSAEFLKTLIV
jgi:hypothetical protein